MGNEITVALAGNPNSGKTTIFNSLTGARQHVGNYPGVTVEKIEGVCVRGDVHLKVVDLPGTYSLTAYSVEEVVARNFLIEEKPDVVVDVIDASNLERNLYLATQLMELNVPLVLVFNMSDVAKARGFEFDLVTLSQLLGAPIVPTVGSKGQGLDDVVKAVAQVASGEVETGGVTVHYGAEVEEELAKVQGLVDRDKELTANRKARWLALKLLENDKEVLGAVEDEAILEQVRKSTAHLENVLRDAPEIVVADRRYGFISGACQETVRSTVEARHNFSDEVDRILANRILGLPIFLGLMYLVFQLTFVIGEVPMAWIEGFFGWLGETIAYAWPKGSDSPLLSLLVDGIIGGVGGVIIFLPNIMLLFLAIALLEDSGYMARAAFVMDHVMHRFRLHGKSFIPMLIGFGCSVPAIMATRTLENRRDRMTTILITPLMSCGARLPIYALLIPAFFPAAWRGPMLWLMYLIGIALAPVCARILRVTLFRGDSTPFVMELPPYRLPTVKGTLIHMWGRSWLYVKKAGTVILGISILLWVLTSYPKKSVFDVDYDGRIEQIQSDYLAGVRTAASQAGLAKAADIFEDAVRVELERDAEQAKYYGVEAGYMAARSKFEAALNRLKAEPKGDLLFCALNTRAQVERAHRKFAEAVAEGGFAEGSIQYTALTHTRDAALAAFQKEDERVYDAVTYFLDNAKGPYYEALATVQAERRAEELAYSTAGRIGHAMEPALRPMGFDWRVGTALIGAFAAKEVFVAQLGIVFSVGDAGEGSDAFRERLRGSYSPLAAFCIMLFCLISAPCMATIAATRSETSSWKWALFQLGGLTALAYVLTTAVYQVGSLLGFGVG